jgi:polyhydroxyalkanoate synthesis regulator phasin
LALVLSILAAVSANAAPMPGDEPSVEDLKARISAASVGDKPHLCVQVAQKRLAEVDKLYASGEMDKAQASLTDVVAFSELARDYAIQSHKYQKQSEIAIRSMTRKLTDILHTLNHEDQRAVQDAVNRLERIRDDLLASMFKKGAR